MDALQYPYNHPQTIPLYEDPYKRPIPWLFKSLIHYANHYRYTDLSLSQQLKAIIVSCTKFCGNPQSPIDLQRFLEIFPPIPIKTREVLPVQFLSMSTAFISGSIRNCSPFDQVVIVHQMEPHAWAIFLVLLTQHRIEQYSMGDVDRLLVSYLTDKLQDYLHKIIGGEPFAINHRLHIPTNFDVNPTIMAFTTVHFLHRHGRYLDLSPAKLFSFQSVHLANLIRAHDRWLGHLHVDGLSILSDSLVVHANKTPESFPELWSLGWAVIDVLGDGNCGYYALMLGLQNHQNTTYSVFNRSTATDWKSKTLQLRRTLQNQSRLLLETEYPRGQRNQQFWERSSVAWEGDDAVDALTDGFASESLADEDYFDNDDFRENPEFHMDATWAPHVFSFTFGMRVVMLIRTTSYTNVNSEPKTNNRDLKKKSKVKKAPSTITAISYSWSTRIFDYNNPVENRDVSIDGIHRMTDLEYKQRPTIEILYTTGWKGKNREGESIPEDNHFQFLRRVIFPDVPTLADPSSHTLQQCLTSPMGKRKGTKNLHMATTKKSSNKTINKPTKKTKHKMSQMERKDPKSGTGKQTARQDTVDEDHENATKSPQTIDPPKNDIEVSQDDDEKQPNGEHEMLTARQDTVDEDHENATKSPQTNDPPNDIEVSQDDDGKQPNGELEMLGDTEVPEIEVVHDKDNTCGVGKAAGQKGNTVGQHDKGKTATMLSRLSSKSSTRKKGKSYRKLKATQTAALTKLYRAHKTSSESDPQVKKLTATKMMFDLETAEFYKKDWDEEKNDFGTAECVEDVEDYNDELVMAALNFEGEWMGPTIKPAIGDARDGIPPLHLSTDIPVLYQQLNKRYCLTYSLASALYYCNFPDEAKWLYECAPSLSSMDFDFAISELRQHMETFVPIIGQPTIYGRKTKRHNKFKRELSWEELFRDITPYPTLVIPVLPTGERTHAFCVVDDLIFDSVTQYALRLEMESVKWVFNDVEPSIYLALRFNTKVSPPKGKGPKIKGSYSREVQHH